MTSNLKLRRSGAPGPGPEATPPRPPKLWSVRDAATYCGVSQQTVRRLIKARRLKSYDAGRQIRIAEPDLLAYLSRKACS